VSDNINNFENSVLAGLQFNLPWEHELRNVNIIKKDVALFSKGVKLFIKTHTEQNAIEIDDDDKITLRNNTLTLRNIFEDSIEPVSRRIQNEVKELEEDEEEEMSKRLENVTKYANTSTHASTVLFIVLMLTGLIIYIAIRKIVTKPIENLQKAAIEIGKGNFETRIETNSTDEIGRLALTLSQMVNELSLQRVTLEKSSTELRNIASRLSLATEAGNIGVWVWHSADNRLERDERMHALYDVASDTKPTLNTWTDALHQDDRHYTEKRLKDAIQGISEFKTEFRILHSNGEVRNIKAAAIVQREETTGAPARMVGVNWDITEQKMLENSNKEAKELAEIASKSKSEFLANMSHEIRTPMNAVN
jgi:signal transduction histidine kinase